MTNLEKGLPLDYRQEETEYIVRCIRAGSSCSVVGVSGMAKSNLYRHLLRSEVRQQYFGDDWERYLFLAADSNALGELSEETMYALILHCLLTEAQQRALDSSVVADIESLCNQGARATEGGAGPQTVLQAFAAALETNGNRHVTLLFDQFDDVYSSFSPRFFANLRAIRDSFKYQVSYVTFTRVELPRLCQAPECEEFYELLCPNLLGLGPYNRRDSWVLIQRVSRRYGIEVEPALGERLVALTGGHPGLLKATLLSSLRGGPSLPNSDSEAIRVLLSHDPVHRECRELWASLSEEEKSTLAGIAFGSLRQEGEPAPLQLLYRKGLVREVAPGSRVVFSGLVAAYVTSAVPAVARELVFDEQTAQVWVEGRTITQDLTKLEFLLLRYLHERKGEVCDRDEIIDILYPDEVSDPDAAIPDSRVDTVVARLREKIEPDRSMPRYIVSVRGRGYKLSTGESGTS